MIQTQCTSQSRNHEIAGEMFLLQTLLVDKVYTCLFVCVTYKWHWQRPCTVSLLYQTTMLMTKLVHMVYSWEDHYPAVGLIMTLELLGRPSEDINHTGLLAFVVYLHCFALFNQLIRFDIVYLHWFVCQLCLHWLFVQRQAPFSSDKFTKLFKGVVLFIMMYNSTGGRPLCCVRWRDNMLFSDKIFGWSEAAMTQEWLSS